MSDSSITGGAASGPLDLSLSSTGALDSAVTTATTQSQLAAALIGNPRNDANGLKEASAVHLGNGVYLTDSRFRVEEDGDGLRQDLTFIHGNGTDNEQARFTLTPDAPQDIAIDLDGTGPDEIGLVRSGVDAGSKIGMVVYADPNSVAGDFSFIGYSRSEQGDVMREHHVTISEGAYGDVVLNNRVEANDVWSTDGLPIPAGTTGGYQGSGVFTEIDGQEYLAGVLVGPSTEGPAQAFKVDPVSDNYQVLAAEMLKTGDADAYARNLLVASEDGGTLDGTGLNEDFLGDAGDDTFIGRAGDDSMSGGEGNDFLRGGADNDTLEGDGGNDRLVGGTGEDQLFGGAGNDRLWAGADDDTLYGGDGDDRVNGGSGNNLMYGGDGRDKVVGRDGNDTGFGGDGNDRLIGNGGDDSLKGENGNDVLLGGDGNDTLQGGDDNDRLVGGKGEDILNGGNDNDRLFGGDDDDTLFGGAGNDVVNGGSGNNEMFGGLGNDRMVGREGNDLAFGGAGNDRFNGGDGSDTLWGGDGRDNMNGQDGDDALFGDDGNDRMSGGAGRDFLFGGDDDDRLDGGTESDTLYGGAGDDQMTGGQAADFFMFGGSIGGGTDTVLDFVIGEDKLVLEGIDFGTGAGEITAAQFLEDNGSFDGRDLRIDLGSDGTAVLKDFLAPGEAVQPLSAYVDILDTEQEDLLPEGISVFDLGGGLFLPMVPVPTGAEAFAADLPEDPEAEMLL